MATHKFDFQHYIDRQKSPSGAAEERGGFGAYAFSGDLRVLRKLERLAPVRLVVEASVRFWKTFQRSDLLGTAVRVNARQFPEFHDQILACSKKLEIVPPTVYVTHNPTINAGTYGTNTESFIVVNSALIDSFTDAQVLFVLGHEAGHIQNNHVVYHTAAKHLANGLGVVVKWASMPAGLALNGWSRRSEITCDRAGLICCMDEKVALESIMRMGLGSQKMYPKMDVDEFVSQLDDIKEGWGRLTELTKTHPYLPKRIKALKLFAESAYYRNLLGEKGGRPLDEIDREIEEIIKVI